MKKKNQNKLCIIPARGGSKRIHKKNIKHFLGKPIISYSIETALESGLFDEVMVSTEDVEIKNIAESCGAKVPFLRSKQAADDFATTTDVILDVILMYSKLKMNFDMACCLYPTAPFTTVEHLKKGMDLLLNHSSKTSFAAVKFSSPIWRGITLSDAGRAELIWPEYLNKRSQDLPVVYHDAGQWYWFDVEEIAKSEKLFTDRSSVVILSENEVHDIDSETDWKIAEIKFKNLRNEI